MLNLSNAKDAELSDKEVQVLILLCAENRAKEIGAELGISPRTVDGIKERLRDKIGARSDAGLVRFALKAGLVLIDRLFPPPTVIPGKR